MINVLSKTVSYEPEIVYAHFSGQFDNDHDGYVKAVGWLSSCQPSSIDKGVWAACMTAMGEAFENTIYHAKGLLGTVEQTKVEVTVTNCMIQIRIWDSGPGFNFEKYMKALPQSVPLYAERGRGLWIINQIADYLNYSQTANQLNCFTIKKKWSPSDKNKPTYH